MKVYPRHGRPWDNYRTMDPLQVPRNVQLIPWPCTLEQLVWLATVIHENKKDLPWWRAKNVNGYGFPEYLLRGFVAEVLFGLRFGLEPDFTLRDGGDNGIDFILPVLLEKWEGPWALPVAPFLR